MQKRRHSRRDRFVRLEPVATQQHPRVARFLAGHQRQRRRTARPLLPQRFDLVVGFLPLGNRRPPVREDGGELLGRTLVARKSKNLADSYRHGIGLGVRGGSDRQPEPAEVVVHVVVAVPAAVHLLEVDVQPRATFITKRLLGDEDGVARLIAPARSLVDAPRGFILAVDGEVDRPGDALLVGLVEEVRFEVSFGVRVIRRHLHELELVTRAGFRLTFDLFDRLDLDGELGQRTRPHE